MIQRHSQVGSENAEASDRRIAEFEQQCRASGLKVTPQRLAIYRQLIATDEHPSAEWVFKRVRQQFPSISFDTVNRTLLTLAKMGAAFIVEGTGDSKRFDGDTHSHQHFRCVNCRRIVDFHHEPFDLIEVPSAISGFRVLRKSVYFEGLCDRCMNIDESQNSSSDNGGQ
jgi:Fur family transcriptional regulator, peroxide stress response regulator